MANWTVPRINAYLSHKQHLAPAARLGDAVQVARDIVALHATSATSPYLSLWARLIDFQREVLDQALYEDRKLVKALCMRVTLHAVAGDELACFHQAFKTYVEKRTPPRFRGGGLLVHAGLCDEAEADARLEALHRRVLEHLAQKGPSTAQEIAAAVPEFQARIRHDVGKPYEGTFGIGSRLISDMCARGLLIRTRVRGTWRSNLYEYAPLADWLPGIDLGSVTPGQGRAWLVRRYLAAFGPATADDVQWWTGFTKTDTKKALQALGSEVVEVAVTDLGPGYLMLAADVETFRDFVPPDEPAIALLPSLDPYIMGYRDRSRFLDEVHRPRLFDRAGNSAPTILVNGRVVGGWGQRDDGHVFYDLFEGTSAEEQTQLAGEVVRLEAFLAGEALAGGFLTPSLDQLAGGNHATQ